MKPTVCVLGAAGMLGRAVVSHFQSQLYDVVALSRDDFDVMTSPVQALHEHVGARTVVVNCAAITGAHEQSVDDYHRLIAVNAVFPRRLASFCRGAGARLIHISSDAVFSGARGSYSELDVPDPVDPYGVSKLLGETGDAMCIRTSIVGRENGRARHLLAQILARRGETIVGYTNRCWNGVTTTTLARVIEGILARDLYAHAVFHVHSPDAMTKYALVRAIVEVFELDAEVVPMSAETPVDRTLVSIHGLAATLVRAGIREQLEELRGS